MHLTLLDKEYVNTDTPIEYKCDICGYVGKLTFSHLRNGTGCRNCSKATWGIRRRIPFDIVRAEFEKNNLTLLSKTYEYATGHLEYKCNTCGNLGNITYENLRHSNGCPKCGCSKGEKAVAKWLINNNIIYASQYTFSDCRSKKGCKLRFDFAVFKSDGKTLTALIEFNGRQHYFPVDFAGKGAEHAEQRFKEDQVRDKLKVDYCVSHSIPLLIIRYDEDITQVLHDNIL